MVQELLLSASEKLYPNPTFNAGIRRNCKVDSLITSKYPARYIEIKILPTVSVDCSNYFIIEIMYNWTTLKICDSYLKLTISFPQFTIWH